MSSYALVQGNTVIPPIFDGALPGWITLPNGDKVSGLQEGVITSDGVYSILPVQYDNAPINSQETGRSYAVSGGSVHVTRTWITSSPPKSTILYPLEFQARFTAQESAAIYAAAVGNAQLLGMLIQQASARYIDLTDPQTIAGVNALVSAGLLTQDRATEILTP